MNNQYDREFNRSFPVQTEGPEITPPRNFTHKRGAKAKCVAAVVCCALAIVTVAVLAGLFNPFRVLETTSYTATVGYDLTGEPEGKIFAYALLKTDSVVGTGTVTGGVSGKLLLENLSPDTYYTIQFVSGGEDGADGSEWTLRFRTSPLDVSEPVPVLEEFTVYQSPGFMEGSGYIRFAPDDEFTPVSIYIECGGSELAGEGVTEADFGLAFTEAGDITVAAVYNYIYKGNARSLRVSAVCPVELFDIPRFIDPDYLQSATDLSGQLSTSFTANLAEITDMYLLIGSDGTRHPLTAVSEYYYTCNLTVPAAGKYNARFVCEYTLNGAAGTVEYPYPFTVVKRGTDAVIDSFTVTQAPDSRASTAAATLIPNGSLIVSAVVSCEGSDTAAQISADGKTVTATLPVLAIGEHSATLTVNFTTDGVAGSATASASFTLSKVGTDAVIDSFTVTQSPDSRASTAAAALIPHDSVIVSAVVSCEGSDTAAQISADGKTVTATLPVLAVGEHSATLTVNFTTDGVAGSVTASTTFTLSKVGTDAVITSLAVTQSATSRASGVRAVIAPNSSALISATLTCDGVTYTGTLSADGKAFTASLPALAPGAHSATLTVNFTTDGVAGSATASTSFTLKPIGTPPTVSDFRYSFDGRMYTEFTVNLGDAEYISASAVLSGYDVTPTGFRFEDNTYLLFEVPVGQTETPYDTADLIYTIKYRLDGYEFELTGTEGILLSTPRFEAKMINETGTAYVYTMNETGSTTPWGITTVYNMKGYGGMSDASATVGTYTVGESFSVPLTLLYYFEFDILLDGKYYTVTADCDNSYIQ